MSNKYSRHQSIINREADSHIDEDHWLKQFEKNLQKSAVQSRRVDQSLFDQINSIMGNSKSKYKSVSAAVEDMMQRSGLTDHLHDINKKSKNNIQIKKASEFLEENLKQEAKEAIDQQDWFNLGHVMGELDSINLNTESRSAVDSINLNTESRSAVDSIKKVSVDVPVEHWLNYTAGYAEGAKFSEQQKEADFINTQNALNKLSKREAQHKLEVKKNSKVEMPDFFSNYPFILNTLKNIVQDTKGNLPVPAVLQKLKSIHSKDIGSVKDFDSEQVLKFINNIILEERKKNPDLTHHHHSNLGLRDVSIDDDNQDAWKGLMPVTK